MKHLVICREYPPSSGGGIGTYVKNFASLLAEKGETVHVISTLWEGATKEREEFYAGRLIIHRLPYQDWTCFSGHKVHPKVQSDIARNLFSSAYSPQCFSWQACMLAEKLVEQEGIDVIEAQEFEAPLYFYMVRKSLGFGPSKTPPCIIHLHSPTEFVAEHNDWNLDHPSLVMARRLEEYVIRKADALVCPSKYLANQVENHYDLSRNKIKVIPYPIGSDVESRRSSDVWKNGSVCYVGRLEKRKGVIEWINAAVAVAQEFPNVQFDFVGANVIQPDRIASEAFIDHLVPKHLKSRFRFHGQKRRDEIAQFLEKARIAVVPSRWENFPFTCMGAMASGLPVIATPSGGMKEVVKDGKSGWISEASNSDALATVLKNALTTPAEQLKEMGSNAAIDVKKYCANGTVTNSHIEFRNQLVKMKLANTSARNIFGNGELNSRPTATTMPKTTQEFNKMYPDCLNNFSGASGDQENSRLRTASFTKEIQFPVKFMRTKWVLRNPQKLGAIISDKLKRKLISQFTNPLEDVKSLNKKMGKVYKNLKTEDKPKSEIPTYDVG